MPPAFFFESSARLNRQKWLSAQIARLARWVGGLLDNIWIENDEKKPSVFLWVLERCRLLYELRSEFRSSVGRIEIVCKEGLWYPGVALGPACEVSPAGVALECNQTKNRTHCSRNLRLEYPWVGSTDLVMFLRGFDAARATPLDSVYTEIEIVSLPSVFLNPEANSLRSHNSFVTPAAIAGVTRNV